MKNFRCLFGKHEYLNFILQLAWIIIRLMFIALFVPSIYYYELQNFSTGRYNSLDCMDDLLFRRELSFGATAFL